MTFVTEIRHCCRSWCKQSETRKSNRQPDNDWNKVQLLTLHPRRNFRRYHSRRSSHNSPEVHQFHILHGPIRWTSSTIQSLTCRKTIFHHSIQLFHITGMALEVLVSSPTHRHWYISGCIIEDYAPLVLVTYYFTLIASQECWVTFR